MNRFAKVSMPFLGVALMFSGCVTSSRLSAPAAHPNAAPLLSAGDPIEVHIRSTTTDLALLDSDALRVADKIHSRFSLAGATGQPGNGRYAVDVSIVNYSTGFDYIRAMLPYTGQVKVDALVRVTRLPSGDEVGVIKVSRSIDPGEITSAASRIADIEEPFVESVVDVLQGRDAGHGAVRTGV